MMVSFSVHVLVSRHKHELKDDRLAVFFGIAAGVLEAPTEGRAINRRFPNHKFITFSHVGLIAIGTLLLLKAVSSRS